MCQTDIPPEITGAIARLGHFALACPKLSADQWFWEVLGITVSAAAIVAICAILAFFDGKATPKLPHGITVRLYLSLESFH
jgi:hypothetical protein